MELNDKLNLVGLCLNILGSIILAFSLGSLLRAILLALKAKELEILSMQHPIKQALKVTGIETHLNKGKKRAANFSWLGVILVIGGFVFQICAFFFTDH